MISTITKNLIAKKLIVRLAAALCVIAVSAGCAAIDDSTVGSSGVVRTESDVCRSQLVGSDGSVHDELNSADIRLLNWNIQKGDDPDWATDLVTSEDNPHLMVLQEVPFNTIAWDQVAKDAHQSFAPGYRTSRAMTGVMTVSAAKPMSQCNLVSLEPWIRSAKATVITEYGLTDTDQTLLVVNIHAVNFTFGTQDFKGQIQEALSVLRDHSGPILLSGDFNTWRPRRSRVLNEMTDSLNLETLAFDEDHRKRVFGQPLDHIYVRGLEVIEATTREVTSSDHNPMSARLQIYSQ
jgi:endonuclease/exonuclease/phosphatase (EEP) superfamily protein YafD